MYIVKEKRRTFCITETKKTEGTSLTGHEGALIFVIETKKELTVEAVVEHTNGAFSLLHTRTTIYS